MIYLLNVNSEKYYHKIYVDLLDYKSLKMLIKNKYYSLCIKEFCNLCIYLIYIVTAVFVIKIHDDILKSIVHIYIWIYVTV